jgi:superfamily II DNA or RNA helicase
VAEWAFRRRRAAVFADTGLGKTRVLLAFAAMVLRARPHGCVLVFGPLCTGAQLAREAHAAGCAGVRVVRSEPPAVEREGAILVAN